MKNLNLFITFLMFTGNLTLIESLITGKSVHYIYTNNPIFKIISILYNYTLDGTLSLTLPWLVVILFPFLFSCHWWLYNQKYHDISFIYRFIDKLNKILDKLLSVYGLFIAGPGIILSIFCMFYHNTFISGLLIYMSLIFLIWSYHKDPYQFKESLKRRIVIILILIFVMCLILIVGLVLYFKMEFAQFHIFALKFLELTYPIIQLFREYILFILFRTPLSKDNILKIGNSISFSIFTGEVFYVYLHGLNPLSYFGKLEGSYFFRWLFHSSLDGWVWIQTVVPVVDYISPPEIIGERLVLRAFTYTKDNVEGLHSLLNDPTVRWTSNSGGWSGSMDKALKELASRLNTDAPAIYYGIFLKNPDGSLNLIGSLGIHHVFSEDNGLATYGYRLLREYQGQGYGTEAQKLFFEFLKSAPTKVVTVLAKESFLPSNYKELDIVPFIVTACPLSLNTPSQKLLLKGGFELVPSQINLSKTGMPQKWYKLSLDIGDKNK